MDYNSIILEKNKSIATITFNRPKAMNAFNTELLTELLHAVEDVAGDDEIRVLIFTGNDKVFAAGGDLSSMSTANPTNIQKRGAASRKIYETVETMDKPVIAAMSGYALGGGCELALACDFRIAADTLQIGLPEIGVGLMPGAGGTVRLAELIGSGWAKYMLMTGGNIDAHTALSIGLVNKVAPVESVLEEANSLALKLAKKAPISLASIKRSIYNAQNSGLASAIQFEQKVFALLFATEDTREGIAAFNEKRKPKFKGR